MVPELNETEKALLQLHIAEYQALTNRNTYYIYIGTTIWSILLLFFAVLVPIIQQTKGWSPYLLWLSCAVGQFSLFMWIDNTVNQYENIGYIEQHLRREVRRLLNSDRFWLYERFLGEGRRQRIQWWELYPTIVSPVLLIGITAWRIVAILATKAFQLSNYGEVAAFLFCGIIALCVARKSRRAIVMRKSFFAKIEDPEPEKGSGTPPQTDPNH